MFNRFVFGLLRDKASDDGAGGGGADKNPVLDTKAIQTMIDTSINGFGRRIEGDFKKQFSALTEQITGFGDLLKKGSQGGGDDDGGGDDGGDKGNKAKKSSDPELNAKLEGQDKTIKTLQKRLDDEAKARKDAEAKREETERHSAIRTELGKHSILPEAVDDAFELFKGKVQRNEDGTLVVGDTTMEAYMKSALEKRTWWQKPADKAGAGSSNAGQRTGRVSLEDIKPGMSKETEAAVLADISRVMAGG